MKINELEKPDPQLTKLVTSLCQKMADKNLEILQRAEAPQNMSGSTMEVSKYKPKKKSLSILLTVESV